MFIFPLCLINGLPTLQDQKHFITFSSSDNAETKCIRVQPSFGKERQGQFERTRRLRSREGRSTCLSWIFHHICGLISLLASHYSVRQGTSYCSPPAVCHLSGKTCYLLFGEVLSMHQRLLLSSAWWRDRR